MGIYNPPSSNGGPQTHIISDTTAVITAKAGLTLLIEKIA